MAKKVVTIVIQERDSEFLHEQKEKEGLSMSFIIQKSLELYREKVRLNGK